MRFHVLGAGPIPSLFAHHLRRATPPSHKIVIIHRKARDALSVKASGIQVQNGATFTTSTDFEHESQDAKNDSPIDSLFITNKGHSALYALRRLAHRILPTSTVVLANNALAVHRLSPLFSDPEQRPHVILATSTHAARHTTTGGARRVVHTFPGRIHYALVANGSRDVEAGLKSSSSDRRLRLSNIASTTGDTLYPFYRTLRNTVAVLHLAESLSAHWCSLQEMQSRMRRRLVVDSIIQPLSILMGCRVGDLFTRTEAVMLARDMCNEAAALFRAEAEAQLRAEYPEPDLEMMELSGAARVPPALLAENLLRDCLNYAAERKSEISPMLNAMLYARPHDLTYLTGHLLASNAGLVDMPVTNSVYRLARMRVDAPIDRLF
ncbi:unnamed protein product [Mycena citricolor]|uniref:2-dehydropantoate 2-reductase n=1 Tax=Mycena citricolor TaxID=2018698 RepID=A0AAD2K5Z6_9AGAR|nr:unnamed protein product [Mycena citricolor]